MEKYVILIFSEGNFQSNTFNMDHKIMDPCILSTAKVQILGPLIGFDFWRLRLGIDCDFRLRLVN